MTNFIFLLVCIIVGASLKQVSVLKKDAHLVLNNILLYVCLPAATLMHTSETVFEEQFIFPILMPWVSFLGAILFFEFLDKYIKFHAHTKAVLILTAGIPSVSFVGFPIFEMLYGKQGLEIGIVMSQAGSFLVCSTLGVMLAAYYSDTYTSSHELIWNVLKFPTFIAFVVAILVNLLGYQFMPFTKAIFDKLSRPLSFLALLSIGFQIDFDYSKWQLRHLKWGLYYKLLVIPFVIYFEYIAVIKQQNVQAQIAVLGSALGPMNTIAIIANKYRLNPPLAAQMVAVGIPLSLVVVYLVYLVL